MAGEVKAKVIDFNLWLYLGKTILRQFPDHSNTNLRWLETITTNEKVFLDVFWPVVGWRVTAVCFCLSE